jgi:hypothetical protein
MMKKDGYLLLPQTLSLCVRNLKPMNLFGSLMPMSRVLLFDVLQNLLQLLQLMIRVAECSL